MCLGGGRGRSGLWDGVRLCVVGQRRRCVGVSFTHAAAAATAVVLSAPPPAPKPTTHPQELQKVLTSMGDLGAQLGGVRQAAGAAAGISQAGAAAGAAAAAAADAVSGGASQP